MQRASFLKHSSIFRIGYRSGFSNSLKSYRKLQRKNENIWGTGSNEYNQLCIPSEQTLLPQRVQGLDTNESFIQIDTCVKHSIGVTGNLHINYFYFIYTIYFLINSFR